MNGWPSGEIRNYTKKDIRHYKDFMRLVQADCLARDLVRVSRSLIISKI